MPAYAHLCAKIRAVAAACCSASSTPENPDKPEQPRQPRRTSSCRLVAQGFEDLAEGAAKRGGLVCAVKVDNLPVVDVNALVLRALLEVRGRVECPAGVIGSDGEESDLGDVVGASHNAAVGGDVIADLKLGEHNVSVFARVAVCAIVVDNNRRCRVSGRERLELGERRDRRAARARVEEDVTNARCVVAELAHVVDAPLLRQPTALMLAQREGWAGRGAKRLVRGHVELTLPCLLASAVG